MPALDNVIVCCSMASWIAVWSLASILSNSSMQQIPLSASIKAPGWITFSWSRSISRTTDAVRPAAVDVLPEAKMPRGRKTDVHLSMALLAVAGSPSKSTLMSPRSLMPSSVFLGRAPINIRRMPFLTSKCPWICGATERARTSKQSFFPPGPVCKEMPRNLSLSAGDKYNFSSDRIFSLGPLLPLPQSAFSRTNVPKKDKRYVRSRFPVPFKPRTPSPPP
mmetsp:Transcript_67254/g.205956  ORF Transcript_67254/g.205956 Transcript_67254/m.205956 type:complete len:221 (-) Transcript_67254:955-1617(-)